MWDCGTAPEQSVAKTACVTRACSVQCWWYAVYAPLGRRRELIPSWCLDPGWARLTADTHYTGWSLTSINTPPGAGTLKQNIEGHTFTTTDSHSQSVLVLESEYIRNIFFVISYCYCSDLKHTYKSVFRAYRVSSKTVPTWLFALLSASTHANCKSWVIYEKFRKFATR